MITDQDIKKLTEVLATKEDIKALSTNINELASDVVRIEEKVDEIDSRLGNIELEVKSVPRMKEIMRDKLGVEV
jgi:predicted  nucleic acid-binding Zn-ribbon protein